jgi:hypothetical protein
MIWLPHDRLPSIAAERHAALREYFCDKDADAELTADGWNLSLDWPGGEDRHVDPLLQQGLEWWGDAVERRSMGTAQRRTGRILSALYDTWTLHSWSEWLAGKPHCAIEEVVILHVDDHRDLAPPRLFMTECGLQDALTGAPVGLFDPGNVRNAILSGAVGMGSFLTPFLHAVPTAQVRHLCQPPKVARTIDHRIELTAEKDTLLQPEALRPAVRLAPQSGATGPGCYRITSHVDAWLSEIGSGPILLHIDMDYFNNRYDGDSDWHGRADGYDHPIEAVLSKIKELTTALQTSGVASRIDDIVVAYSPGFFPAEFWAPAEACLRPGLERLHLSESKASVPLFARHAKSPDSET